MRRLMLVLRVELWFVPNCVSLVSVEFMNRMSHQIRGKQKDEQNTKGQNSKYDKQIPNTQILNWNSQKA